MARSAIHTGCNYFREIANAWRQVYGPMALASGSQDFVLLIMIVTVL
jgi:hypothetical protein